MSFNGNQIREFINGVTLNFAGYLQDEFVRLYANDNWLKTQVDTLLASAVTYKIGYVEDSMDIEARSAVHPWFYWHEPDTVVSVVNAPQAIPVWRNRRFGRLGSAGMEYTLDATDWDVSDNVGEITFDDTDKNNEILTGASGMMLKSGKTWAELALVIYVPAVGNIAAGDKIITGLTLSTRKATFDETASDGSGSATFECGIYQHRIKGSTTTAMWRQRKGTAYSPGDGVIAGAGHQDMLKGHKHEDTGLREPGVGYGATGTQVILAGGTGIIGEAIEGINGPVITGDSNRASGEGVYRREFVGEWIS